MQPYNNHHTTLGTGLCPSHTQNQLYSSGNFQTSCQNLIVMASLKVVAGIVVYEWIDNKKLIIQPLAQLPGLSETVMFTRPGLFGEW